MSLEILEIFQQKISVFFVIFHAISGNLLLLVVHLWMLLNLETGIRCVFASTWRPSCRSVTNICQQEMLTLIWMLDLIIWLIWNTGPYRLTSWQRGSVVRLWSSDWKDDVKGHKDSHLACNCGYEHLDFFCFITVFFHVVHIVNIITFSSAFLILIIQSLHLHDTAIE